MKRVALVCSLFYPTPIVGSVRVTNWAKMLPEQGYQPIVVTRDLGYRASLETLARQVHPDVELLQLDAAGREVAHEDRQPVSRKLDSPQQQGLKQSLIEQATWWWTPDPSIRFWRKAYPLVREYVEQRVPDVILSTSPMGATADVARWLSRDLQLPWVADFRDPPLLDKRAQPQGISKLTLPRHRAWLASVYNRADAVLHAVPTQARWARMAYPSRRKRIAILRHPVPGDLADGKLQPVRSKIGGRKTIAVVGSLSHDVLIALASAIQTLVEREINPLDLELRLVGKPLSNPQPLLQLIGDRLVMVGRVPNSQAKAHMLGADVLVNANSLDRQQYLGISSKLFEYAGARRPIICINPTRPDRQLLRELPSEVLQSPSSAQLETAIEAAIIRDSSATSKQAFTQFVEDYSWQRHAARLAQVLDCVSSGSSGTFDLRDL